MAEHDIDETMETIEEMAKPKYEVTRIGDPKRLTMKLVNDGPRRTVFEHLPMDDKVSITDLLVVRRIGIFHEPCMKMVCSRLLASHP